MTFSTVSEKEGTTAMGLVVGHSAGKQLPKTKATKRHNNIKIRGHLKVLFAHISHLLTSYLPLLFIQ